jgi:flavin-dependent dehydrogenase
MNSWLCFTVPSLSHIGNLWMFQITGDRYMVGTSQQAGFSAAEATENFMRLPAYQPWFKNARVVGKQAFSMDGMFRPLETPMVGNVLILGEAAGVGETSNPGAIACGYQAARAVLKELNGEPGFEPYCRWWRQAFEGIDPDHSKAAARFFSLNSLCTDEEVDYLYQSYRGEIGVPAITIAGDLDRIKDARPELYRKLKATGMAEGLKAMKLEWGDVLDRKADR